MVRAPTCIRPITTVAFSNLLYLSDPTGTLQQMRCPIRPYRFRTLAAVLVAGISVGLLGVGLACAAPVQTQEKASPSPRCCEEGKKGSTTECQSRQHVLSRPLAVLPSFCGVSTDRDVDLPGSAASSAYSPFVRPTLSFSSVTSTREEWAVRYPVPLHVLYEVFLD